MGHIFQSCLTELFPFTMADSMPLLRIAINLVSSDRNAELIGSSPFSALCTSSFLYPYAEESSPWMAARVVRLITRIFIHQSDSFAVPGEVVNEIIEKFVGILQVNSEHYGLSGALLKFFSAFLNFRQGAHLIDFVEHHVFGVVAELISEGFLDTPSCWGLFADACRYALFYDEPSLSDLKAHLDEVIDLSEAWAEMTPGMDIGDGDCCKNEYNVLCLTYHHILLFQEVPDVVTTELFVMTGEMILEDARPDVIEMFIILIAQVVEILFTVEPLELDFSVLTRDDGILAGVLKRAIGSDESITNAALRVLHFCVLKSIVGVPNEFHPALFHYETNTGGQNSPRQLGQVAAFLSEAKETGGELAEYADEIFNQCYPDVE
jgi:hypothetical protein